MIGNELANQLFPAWIPSPRTLDRRRPFQVVGIREDRRHGVRPIAGHFAYIPIQTYFKMYGTTTPSGQHPGAWRGVDGTDAGGSRVMMRARRHLAPNDKDNFGIFDQATLMELWKN